jgi:phospholipase C
MELSNSRVSTRVELGGVVPTDLKNIDTIVIVIMENRSFDHMLGYLSLPDVGRGDIEGLKSNNETIPFSFKDAFLVPGPFAPFRLPDPRAPLPGDPPHERSNIVTQLGTPIPNDKGVLIYPMDGFVKSFSQTIPVGNNDLPMVMGYFTGQDLPTYNFFADNFTVCDHWFASLPAGTQPNRLMAMSGESGIEKNKDVIPDQTLVYDWLDDDAHKVRWRVYHEGIPFFCLMPERFPAILADHEHFRSFESFDDDVQHEPEGTFPHVIFVEPRYTNAPHIDTPHDDHAPSAVDGGQRFLMQVYAALTANPDRWAKSVMIVTYDEHGGFFDHISPPLVPTVDPNGKYETFTSLGARVPAFIVSPYVNPRSAFNSNLDHTAILQLLGDKFNGGQYSTTVSDRVAAGGLASAAATLTLDSPRAEIPQLPAVTQGFTSEHGAYDVMSLGFEKAWQQIKDNPLAKLRFPKLFGHFR